MNAGVARLFGAATTGRTVGESTYCRIGELPSVARNDTAIAAPARVNVARAPYPSCADRQDVGADSGIDTAR